MLHVGTASATGRLKLKVTRRKNYKWHIRFWKLRQFLRHGWREMGLGLLLFFLPIVRWFIPGLTIIHSTVALKLTKANGDIVDYGVIGRHLVVTAGKNYVAACFDNTNEPESLKFHGFGTGTTSAAAGDTALQTELTTQYATDNTRPTGSQTHSSATYTTVGTLSPDASCAITEWGLFSANAAGTMLDHQVFSAVNLVSGDSLAATYVLTIG